MNVYSGVRRAANVALALVAVWGCALGAAFGLILVDPAGRSAVGTFLALGGFGTACLAAVRVILWGFSAPRRRKLTRSEVPEA